MVKTKRSRRICLKGEVDVESSSRKTGIQLLSYQELPDWQKENEFIHHGYRPEFKSTRACFDSLYYMHNETLSIYTHLVPAILTIAVEGFFFQYLDKHYPRATQSDYLIFAIWILTAVTCCLISSIYHTMVCHSENMAHLWLKADFIGIMVLMVGDFVSGIYLVFYCEPHLRAIYWSMILTLGALCCFILLNPKFHGPKYRNLRIFAFVGTGLSGFAPLIHGSVMFGIEKMMKQSGMPYYIFEGFLLLTGTVFYGTRFPESKWPGKFDIWFSSHQIFHVFVVLATAVHWLGITLAYDYNYTHRQCRV
ncbi:hypothetical protein H072_563 [Dactylellina haptotyla CBS 200.50]|uniref:Uncharacterized protein n=1 Tax=Dactylellina haptotyla (strain CBS 200.50) TaxID=1284197 RepID=S8ARG9_DACHA|nr:hypothetical protein H072_563 [Dactylellina haptotyla CBS 200.50]